jgi:dipeptidyl aminopeptidase/acylaminoacyl peptidase
MSEFTDLLERARGRFPAPEIPLERVVRRRERQVQKQRIAAVVLALALVVAGVGVAVSVGRGEVSPGGAGIVVPGDGSCDALSPADPCWDTDIFVTSADGSGLATRLGLDQGRDLAFSWSPDGERIAFLHAADDTGDADIFTMAADGSDVRRLTDEPGVDAFPTYSPDGTEIAFQSDRAGKVDVYVMDADGSNVVRLTDFDDDQRDDYVPTWSPDGERIAFVRGQVPPGGVGELWVIDADGSNGHLLLDQPPIDFPAWSPDGTRIAFELGQWPDVHVGVLDLTTGIVHDLGPGFHPIWSPDSTKLAISIVEGGFQVSKVEEPASGTVLVHETGWAAAWSPDGASIVFNDAGLTATGAEPVLQAPPAGETLAGFTERGIPFLIVRHTDGTLTAVEAVSPHLATDDVRKLLGWCASSRTFDDPFHGARFDEYGRYILGPSPSGLVPLSIEVVTADPLTFRLGAPLSAIPRGEPGNGPTGPFCADVTVTPLIAPDIAGSGLTPEELAASSPPSGSRWSIEATLVVPPDGEAQLCASYVDGVCEAGAAVTGPVAEGQDELVIEGTWFVIVRDGSLEDPIRAS